MKCPVRSTLLIVLILAWVVYGGYRLLDAMFGPEDPHVVCTSDSPDGKWRCVAMDIDPDQEHTNLVLRVERTGGTNPWIDGTYQAHYQGWSFITPEPLRFEWADNSLLVWYSGSDRGAFVCEFDEYRQHWREIPFTYPQTRPTIPEPSNRPVSAPATRATVPGP